MIIECVRCKRPIESPDHTNADYVIAPDTIVNEVRDCLFVLKDNVETKEKKAKGQEVADSEYDTEMVESLDGVEAIPDFVKCVPREALVKVQKTGIVCPECYRDTDFVIWGVHKKNISPV